MEVKWYLAKEPSVFDLLDAPFKKISILLSSFFPFLLLARYYICKETFDTYLITLR